MLSTELYNLLENDFELSKCTDDWSQISSNSYISPYFRNRYMGILCDNAKEIEKVYTAVFLNNNIVGKILERNEENFLIFTHHPMQWDITKLQCFENLSPDYFPILAKRNISVYTLHTPLDKNGPYSTTMNFVKSLGLTPKSEFYDYFGHKVGIIAKSPFNSIAELTKVAEKTVNHRASLYIYGDSEIKNGTIASIAGGGNIPEVINYIADAGINTMVTGITKCNPYYQPSLDAHEIAKRRGINLIGTTHYSSEKFACIEMVKYFEALGLEAEFIEDKPCLDDL